MKPKRLLVACLLSIALVGPCLGKEVTYRGFAGKRFAIALNEATKTIRIADVISDAEFCDSTSEYYCFYGEGIAFYVPRAIGDQKSWVGSGITFEVVGTGASRVLGTEVHWLRIEADTTAGRMYYLYSRERGLIAFGGMAEDGNEGLFLVEDCCGFGTGACQP